MAIQGMDIKLADRIWIAVATLHRESAKQDGFSRDEIRSKLREIGLSNGLKPSSVAAHLQQHLVANRPKSTTGYRMLFETASGQLRLLRPGDYWDPERRSKQVPTREEIPTQYHPLLDWYEEWIRENSGQRKPAWEDDPLVRLIGSGKHIWADEHADEYVENLRREDV
jgi:hypothetical protein